MNQPKAWAAIIVRGNLRPEEISISLKMESDFSYSVGEGESTIWHWQYNSRLLDEDSLNIHLLELLRKIAPVRKQFQDISEKTETIFYCSVEMNTSEEAEGVILEPRLLALLGNLGAKLEIHRWNSQRSV